MGIALQQNE
jgi:hypothetical protein